MLTTVILIYFLKFVIFRLAAVISDVGYIIIIL